MKCKCVAIGIIFLFIGVVIAPSINFNTGKASKDDKLVEVTIQACGIKGYKDTTVKLTKEQYKNLKQYLVEFRTRLNQTSTREEATPIFKEAVLELDMYGLLPEGMNIEQAQKFITGTFESTHGKSMIEKLFYKNIYQDHYFCSFVTGVVHDGYAMGILYMIGMILLLLSIFPSPFPFLPGNELVFLLGALFIGTGSIITTFSPLSIMQQIHIFSGNMTLLGLGGSLHFNEGLLNGFNGIKITRIDTKEMHLVGFSLMISYPE